MSALDPLLQSPYVRWLFDQFSPSATGPAAPGGGPIASYAPAPAQKVLAGLPQENAPTGTIPGLSPNPTYSSFAGGGNSAMNMPSYTPPQGGATGGLSAADAQAFAQARQSANPLAIQGGGKPAKAKGAGASSANSPLGDWIGTAQRLGLDPKRIANVYMDPNDPHHFKDPMEAMGEAMADDAWGRAAAAAHLFTGDEAHDKLLWQQHYYAKFDGRRDPLEGHPEAIQQLQADAANMANSGSQDAYDQAQKDLQNAGLG